MPPPYLKFVGMFGSNEGYGWTEVHYKQAVADLPNLQAELNAFMDGLMTARAALCAQDTYVVGGRVSYKSTNGHPSNGKRRKMPGTDGKQGASPAISLAVEMQNSLFTKSKIIHLRGFWDEVEYDESYHGETIAGWQDRLINWLDILKAGYGWMSRDDANSVSGVIDSYAVNEDETVTFTLKTTNPMPLATVDTKQFIRFSKFGAGRSILNRQLQVNVDSVLRMTTTKPIGASGTSSSGRFNYRAVSFVPYAFSDSISIGERRMGKPLNRRPGRSQAQTLI